jgi:survival-of-motor-neuron-related-splicing factor 30
VFQAQLAMIELALAADPQNSELAQLRTDLQTLIQLTQESLEEEEQAKEGPSNIYLTGGGGGGGG